MSLFIRVTDQLTGLESYVNMEAIDTLEKCPIEGGYIRIRNKKVTVAVNNNHYKHVADCLICSGRVESLEE